MTDCGTTVPERTVTIKVRYLWAAGFALVGITLFLWQVAEWKVISARLGMALVLMFLSGLLTGGEPKEDSI